MTATFAAYEAALAVVRSAVPAGCIVYDGPQAAMPTEKQAVLFGVDDPLSTGMVTAVDMGAQDWADIGAFVKSEDFTIMSTVIVWDGSTNLAPVRATAATIIAAIESTVRLSHNRPNDLLNGTSGALGPTGWANFAATRIQQIQTSSGAAVHVGFAIACTTQI